MRIRVVALNSFKKAAFKIKPPVYLMEGVLPHVSAGQRLIKGKHHRVVFSIRLVAPLSDPALVVRQRVVEAPEA